MLFVTPSTRTPNRLASGAAGLILLAEFGQVLASAQRPALILPYVLLHVGFAGFFFFQLLRPARGFWLHVSLAVQAGLVSAILFLNPEIGTVAALFVLLSWLAARAAVVGRVIRNRFVRAVAFGRQCIRCKALFHQIGYYRFGARIGQHHIRYRITGIIGVTGNFTFVCIFFRSRGKTVQLFKSRSRNL